jgi:hypothetical protein
MADLSAKFGTGLGAGPTAAPVMGLVSCPRSHLQSSRTIEINAIWHLLLYHSNVPDMTRCMLPCQWHEQSLRTQAVPQRHDASAM